jgi:hypothetical protein
VQKGENVCFREAAIIYKVHNATIAIFMHITSLLVIPLTSVLILPTYDLFIFAQRWVQAPIFLLLH